MRPSRKNFTFLTLFSRLFLSMAALVVAGPVFARSCLEDPAISGRTCPAGVCVSLQDDVNWLCKPKPKKCARLTGCLTLKKTRQQFLNCYTARTRMNVICWNGGDLNHQREAARAIDSVFECNERIALPEPVGCEDPCPQLPNSTQSTHSNRTAENLLEQEPVLSKNFILSREFNNLINKIHTSLAPRQPHHPFPNDKYPTEGKTTEESTKARNTIK